MKRRDRVIDDIMTLTDMESRKNDIINGLSRGMQQRVSLARVLINDPDLLLLDEPAAGLDPRGRIELMEILRELRSMGKTIFISSHILSELADVCDSLTIIDRGRIKYSGPISHLLKHDHEYSTYRLDLANGAPDIQPQLAELPGVVIAEMVDDTSQYKLAFDPTQTDTNALLQAIMGMGVSDRFVQSRTKAVEPGVHGTSRHEGIE